MKDMIYITGHRNPDTDSICSALAYAEFKNKSANVQAKPIRLGEISRETQFALDYFKVQKPELMKTLRPLAKDLEMDRVPPLTPETSLKTAWVDMKNFKVKTIPVVDNNNKFLGIVSLSNLTSAYMDIWDNYILTKSKTPFTNVVDALSAKILYKNDDLKFCGGKIIVAAMNPDSMKKIMETGDVVICGDREDTQMSIVENKSSLMIVAGNHEVSKKVLDYAEANNCTVISTPFDSFTASRMIVQSIPIRYVMSKEELICFRDTDHVEHVREAMARTRFRSYPILDTNNKVLGMISRFHLISRVNKKVILVDHNESAQSVDGLETAEVTEIIDHHRIADIQTSTPIYFRNQPVGCTGTIIGSIFFENGLTPSKETAGLLCSAIISDTLLFKSPTSTPLDKEMVEKLAKIAEIDVEEYAKKMFKAGTSLAGRTVEEIFNTDFKTFSLLNHKIGVAQVSTMDIDGFKPMKEEMINYMEKNCEENNYDLLVLLLTDIIQDGSEVIAIGNRADYIESAFNVALKNNSAYVPGLLSRKKQVIPPITKAIELSQQ